MGHAPLKTDKNDELRASLLIKYLPGVGPRTWKKIFSHYSSAVNAWDNRSQWGSLGIVRPSIAKSMGSGEGKSLFWAEKEAEAVIRREVNWIGLFDAQYPALLAEIADPPLILYYQGRIEFLKGPCLGVVGSRKAGRYGLEAAMAFAEHLSKSGLTIVSGFADGVDQQAHLGGLAGCGKSVGVLGTGIDIVYPASNMDLWKQMAVEGLIVTEFAPGVKPDASNFPRRNRIISGLSLGVLVVQAAVKSGSLITARMAVEQGREVFAVPGQVGRDFEGGHWLIRQGALLVNYPDDILRELAPLLKSAVKSSESSGAIDPAKTGAKSAIDRLSLQENRKPVMPPGLTPDEISVWKCLSEKGSVHIDKIVRNSGLECGSVSAQLVMLEMRGVVKQSPGQVFSLC